MAKEQKEMHFPFCSFLSFLVQNTRGMNFIPIATVLTISVCPYICKNIPAVVAGCLSPWSATWLSQFCWLFSLIQNKLHGMRQAAYFSSNAKQSNPHCIFATIIKIACHRNYTWWIFSGTQKNSSKLLDKNILTLQNSIAHKYFKGSLVIF